MPEWFTTTLELIGLAAIVVGVAVVFWPAALIVLGVSCILISRGGVR